MGVKRSGGLGGKLKALTKDMYHQLDTAVYSVADQIATDAAYSITAGSVSGKNHVPSKPGEPPNADTLKLSREMGVRITGPLTAQVVSPTPYAQALEFGTSKMAERPFFRPAVKRNRARGLRQLERAVDHVLDGGKFRPD
jgi:HK97 gp10 family phage protein